MAEPDFPTTWNASKTDNNYATHCFDIRENDGKMSRVLLTIDKIVQLQQYSLIEQLYRNLSTQIFMEQRNMVETDVVIQALPYGSGSGAGYYFMATDKNYNGLNDDWPFMMRCGYVSQKYLIDITVLCYNKESIAISQVMDWVKMIN